MIKVKKGNITTYRRNKSEKIEYNNSREIKKKNKGKSFTALSTKEKDELLERIAKDLGYL